jgi:dipeptidyl aminopeptidase/acylaminoacyl peptidase
MRARTTLLTLAALCAALPAAALATARQAPLTLHQISRDFRWYTRSVAIGHWSDDGTRLYYRISGEQELDPSEVWQANASDQQKRRLSEEEEFRLTPAGQTAFGSGYHETRHLWSPDGKRRLVIRDGDVVLVDTTTGTSRPLTRTPAETESSPRFLADGRRVSFQRGANLFVLSLDDHTLEQVTDFRTGKKPQEPDEEPELKTEQEKILRKEQLELFETLQKEAQQRKINAERERRRRKLLARPEPYYIPEGKRVASPVISPDGAYVTFILAEPPKDVKTAVVPRYVTESGFTEAPAARPKVGAPRERSQVQVLTVETGEVRPLKLPQNGKPFSYGAPQWSPDGRHCLIPAWSLDLKDRWLLGVDVKEARGHIVDDWHDAAWIGGPGPEEGWWMPDSRHIYFLSEADGWSHLYIAPYDGGTRRRLTSGRFEVSRVQLSRDGSQWFLLSNEEHPGELNLYTMPVQGGPRTRITTQVQGVNGVLLSPDEQQVALMYSAVDRPAEVGLMDCRPGAPVQPLTSVTTPAFLERTWIVPEIVSFEDPEGHRLYARLYQPSEPSPERPAVLMIHGAGYAQAAHRRWAATFFYANFLAEQGYHVLDLDYRGSAGYGRECRTAIYRHMGKADVDSAAAGIDYLAREHRVDRQRIGVMGGSYGGFYTLMALFTRPGVFAAGAASFPVTDWYHYNHWYTSRILNDPDVDPIAYRRSSPIYHAGGLQDRLLILHGLADDNVHAQDTIRLVQKLIELEKPGWEFAVYPTDGHGWGTPASRLDAYRRTFELFENALKASRPSAETARDLDR